MSNCPFKFGDVCLWASKLANNLPVVVSEGDCYACMRQQRLSKQKKGHKYRRTNIVTKLASEKISNALGWNYDAVYKKFQEYDSWKLCHMNSYISSKANKYFDFLTTIGFYESVLDDALTDWNYYGLLSCLKQCKDDHSQLFPDGFYPSTKDLDSKQSFFKSFNKFLTSQGDQLGDVLREVEYPTWVDPISDQQPNPKNNKCLITVVTGEKYVNMFNKVRHNYEEYCKRIGADFIILENFTQGWWGLEKFRIKPFVEAYENTCFIDSDILIQPNAPDIFKIVPNGFVGIHDDWPFCLHKAPLETPPFDIEGWRRNERRLMINAQVKDEDFSWELYPALLNTGVVVTPKEHALIWTAPTKPFARNHCDEQFWVDYNIRKNNIPYWPLPVSMNFQYWHKCFDYYFHRSDGFYFLHVAIDDGGDKIAALDDVLERRYVVEP